MPLYSRSMCLKGLPSLRQNSRPFKRPVPGLVLNTTVWQVLRLVEAMAGFPELLPKLTDPGLAFREQMDLLMRDFQSSQAQLGGPTPFQGRNSPQTPGDPARMGFHAVTRSCVAQELWRLLGQAGSYLQVELVVVGGGGGNGEMHSLKKLKMFPFQPTLCSLWGGFLTPPS